MKLFFFAVVLFMGDVCVGQKPVLDTNDFNKWRIADNPQISADGKYVSYVQVSRKAENKLVIRSVADTWSQELQGVRQSSFSMDGKYFICLFGNADLMTLDLRTHKTDVISGVKSYSLVESDKDEWIAVHKKQTGEFILHNLRSRINKTFGNKQEYFLGNDNKSIVLKVKKDSLYDLSLLSLQDKREITIFHGLEPNNVTIDRNGNQIVFFTMAKNHKGGMEKSVWYYRKGVSTVAERVELTCSIPNEYELDVFDRFSKDGKFVFCQVAKKLNSENQDRRDLSIWSYTDPKLKSEKQNDDFYSAIWYIDKSKLVRLQEDGELPLDPWSDNLIQIRYKAVGNSSEWNWNDYSVPLYSLLNLSDGNRIAMSDTIDRYSVNYFASPNGKYVVYYNVHEKSYFVYDISKGTRRNITSNVDADWTTFDDDDIPFSRFKTADFGGFSKDGNVVFLYDKYDIFSVNLEKGGCAIDLTKGYGKVNSIVFRFAFKPETWSLGSRDAILTAFNRRTKEDGFFKLKFNGLYSLEKLHMESASFCGPVESKYFYRFLPIKAKNSSEYLVRKMTSSSSPNFYVTKDFRKFKAISNVHPEDSVNWLTTEMIEFKTNDGRDVQGVLYKPENFDPQKKYPVIFYFYEKISECLNLFIAPDVSMGPMNIPYFVSNGYLVFTPDIHFKIGYPGKSSFNTVMGAADRLAQLPYVDTTRMGLQGHSFGGFQVNYIITHTNRFAAACSAAGFTNFVSAYGSIILTGYSRQGQYELYRDRIGASLWDRSDLYLENSPVLRIDKMSTPLLLMHNKADDDVPYTQGVELFTGMRRMGKVVYFLQYNNAGHMVFGNAARDYSKRLLEFFNYYLKGRQLPQWMKEGPLKTNAVSHR